MKDNDWGTELNVTREELYEHVWKTPLTKLSKELGLHYPALVSLCQRLNVPRPEQGHWLRQKLGLPVERPPLTEVGPVIVADAPRDSEAPNITSCTDPPEKSGPTADSITVPENLVGCHPITAKLRRSLEGRRGERTGLVEPAWRDAVFSVSVSKAQIQRTLKIMDALIRAVESRGGQFIKPDKDCAWIRMQIAGECVGFRVLEIVEKREKPLKLKEVASGRRAAILSRTIAVRRFRSRVEQSVFQKCRVRYTRFRGFFLIGVLRLSLAGACWR